MHTRDVRADIAWLNNAIAETRKRIDWNNENKWFEVVGEEWVDVTDRTNARLEADILQCEIMLDAAKKKL